MNTIMRSYNSHKHSTFLECFFLNIEQKVTGGSVTLCMSYLLLELFLYRN